MLICRRRRVSLTALLALAFAGCTGSSSGDSLGVEASPSVGPRVELLDTDGDSLPDVARAVGDWDGDGMHEIEDVQGALDALTDDGPKIVELIPGAVFSAKGMRNVGANVSGLIELPNHTTLDCQGSRLEGVDADTYTRGAWATLLATVTNADHAAGEGVHVENCSISGGMPASYDSISWRHNIYMGIAFIGVRDGSLRRSQVEDTHHACVYVKNAVDVVIEGNLLERCGGASDKQQFRGQPSIYLFQADGQATERVTVRANQAIHAGGSLYNTRVSANNRQYQSSWMRDVVFESNYGEDDDGDLCFNLRGARHVSVLGNVCAATAGIALSYRNEAYCEDNPPVRIDGDAESACLEDVEIRGNRLVGNWTSNSVAIIDVPDYQDGVRVVNNAIIGVQGPAAPSFRVELPVRGLEVHGLDLVDCAGPCLRVDGAPQYGVPGNERLTLRDVVADGAGLDGVIGQSHPCLHFRAAIDGALLEDVSASRCSRSAIWVEGGARRTTFRRFEVDGLRVGYAGTFDLPSSGLPACDAGRQDRWIVARGADASCSGLPGSREVRCGCRDGEWAPFQPRVFPGVQVEASEGLLMEDGRVANVDAHAGVMFGAGSEHEADLAGIQIEQPGLGSGVLSPMTRGVWDASGSGGIVASDVSCDPEAVSHACLDLGP